MHFLCSPAMSAIRILIWIHIQQLFVQCFLFQGYELNLEIRRLDEKTSNDRLLALNHFSVKIGVPSKGLIRPPGKPFLLIPSQFSQVFCKTLLRLTLGLNSQNYVNFAIHEFLIQQI